MQRSNRTQVTWTVNAPFALPPEGYVSVDHMPQPRRSELRRPPLLPPGLPVPAVRGKGRHNHKPACCAGHAFACVRHVNRAGDSGPVLWPPLCWLCPLRPRLRTCSRQGSRKVSRLSRPPTAPIPPAAPKKAPRSCQLPAFRHVMSSGSNASLTSARPKNAASAGACDSSARLMSGVLRAPVTTSRTTRSTAPRTAAISASKLQT